MRPSTQLVARCLFASSVAAGTTSRARVGAVRGRRPPVVARAGRGRAGPPRCRLGRARARTVYRWTVVLVALVSCALAAWWVWVPEPHLYSVVRDHQASATQTAERAIAGSPIGTCRVPTAADLGVLAEAGPWAKVCVVGTDRRLVPGVSPAAAGRIRWTGPDLHDDLAQLDPGRPRTAATSGSSGTGSPTRRPTCPTLAIRVRTASISRADRERERPASDRGGVPRLVEQHADVAGEDHRGDDAESLVLGLAVELDALRP